MNRKTIIIHPQPFAVLLGFVNDLNLNWSMLSNGRRFIHSDKLNVFESGSVNYSDILEADFDTVDDTIERLKSEKNK